MNTEEKIILELRLKLQPLVNKEKKFTAIIGRKSYINNNLNNPTIILKEVKDENGLIVANHIWQDFRSVFKKRKTGDTISFIGKVVAYKKSVGTEDYNIKIIKIIE